VAVDEHEAAQVLTVTAPAGLELTTGILACLDGTKVGRVSTREPTLEDAYVSLVTAER
jgi:ABC-2 type transport system ATP-binding protein